MLEVPGGFSVGPRLGERNEKRVRTRSKEEKMSGVCGVRKWPEKEGKWSDTSARVAIVLCI